MSETAHAPLELALASEITPAKKILSICSSVGHVATTNLISESWSNLDLFSRKIFENDSNFVPLSVRKDRDKPVLQSVEEVLYDGIERQKGGSTDDYAGSTDVLEGGLAAGFGARRDKTLPD